MKANILVVYYTGEYTRTLLPSAASFLARVNPIRRARFERRTGPQRALDLASLRLLEVGMAAGGHREFRLADVEYPTENGIDAKPRCNKLKDVDFSLSHTTGMVACAIATRCRVGCDVEHSRPTNPLIVRRILRDDAQLAIGLTADNALSRWTRIEAVLKGAGLGIMHAREIDWRSDAQVLRGEQWQLHTLPLPNGHVGHIATDAVQMDLQVRQITDNEIAG